MNVITEIIPNYSNYKTKQVKHLLIKINLAQQYFVDKLYIVQTPTEGMIADSLTKSKAPYNYASKIPPANTTHEHF